MEETRAEILRMFWEGRFERMGPRNGPGTRLSIREENRVNFPDQWFDGMRLGRKEFLIDVFLTGPCSLPAWRHWSQVLQNPDHNYDPGGIGSSCAITGTPTLRCSRKALLRSRTARSSGTVLPQTHICARSPFQSRCWAATSPSVYTTGRLSSSKRRRVCLVQSRLSPGKQDVPRTSSMRQGCGNGSRYWSHVSTPTARRSALTKRTIRRCPSFIPRCPAVLSGVSTANSPRKAGDAEVRKRATEKTRSLFPPPK